MQLLEGLRSFSSDVLFQYVPKLLYSLLFLFIGWKLIKWFTGFLHKIYVKKNFDKSLQSFLHSIIDIALKVLLLIAVAEMLGIQMTSFIALLGAIGLAIGMALQGTLQNFAGGVIILILKPFRMGDFIEQGGLSGTVQEIRIFNTILKTLDNKIVIVPNTQLATNTVINYTRSGKRRVEVNVGIAYGEDVNKARSVLVEMTKKHPLIMQDEENAPSVIVTSLDNNSVNIQVRAWVKSDDYLTVLADLQQDTYETLNQNNIVIPFNQMTVHLNNQ